MATEETDEGREKSAKEDEDGDVGRMKLSKRRRIDGEKKDGRVEETRPIATSNVHLKNDRFRHKSYDVYSIDTVIYYDVQGKDASVWW